MRSTLEKNQGKSRVLQGGGITGELIRNFDWAKTPLGDFSNWPNSLQSALGICINSNFPIAIYWGPELNLIYNDAWSPIPGNKHPWALGKPAREVWPDIWADIEPQFKLAFTGQPGGSRDALLPMQRHGYTEECYFDFTFTPIYGDSGSVDGIFNAVIETTYRVISERRGNTLQHLAQIIAPFETPGQVFNATSRILSDAVIDIPFHFIYSADEEGRFQLIPGTGTDIPLLKDWPVDEITGENSLVVEEISAYFHEVPSGSWPEKPCKAFISRLTGVDGKTMGYLVLGISARLEFNKEYQSFFDSVVTIISRQLMTISSLVEERRRAEELAKIDKAKTAFFSNISHEFRTPLTLILSPLESVLEKAGYLDPAHKNDLEISLRNTIRLQKLVNTLLDFSRIEYGKMDANPENTNLEELTEDLASSFRSAIEAAGITYHVSLEKIGQPVAVDVDMWEKIVLNLISNAFKYTHAGRIDVRLFRKADQILLEIADTGVGIDDTEKEKIFERFYRVYNADGRSQEGTGIGLALVRELVTLQGGDISFTSEKGQGSVFTVKLPIRALPAATKATHGQNLTRRAFVDEVSKWNTVNTQQAGSTEAGMKPGKKDKGRILLADDNLDMREYVERLLEQEFEVIPVSNGEDALKEAISKVPDLIISDIMMPGMDGFELLKRLKTNLVTRNIPVVFLSARAGEEAKVEGLVAGADDYLVKPFSARELLARVSNHILISRTRRATEKQFYNLFLQSPAHIHVMKGPEHTFEFFHPLGRKIIGKDITGKKAREALPELEGQGYFEMLDQVYQEGKEFHLQESRAVLPGPDGKMQEFYFNITYLPWRGLNNNIQGVLQFTFDVTEQAKARLLLEEAESNLQNAVDLGELGTWHIDLKKGFVTYSGRVAEWWGLGPEGDTLEAVINCMHKDDRGKVSEAVQQAIDVSGFYTAEYRLYNAKDGRERYIHANGKVFYDDDRNPVRMSGIVRDVTMEKMAQTELRRLVDLRTEELRDINEALQRSNEDLRQFAYVASHDLQEPLRKIQTFSDLAAGSLDDREAAAGFLEKIDRSASRMSALIKDVLAYSQASNKEGFEDIVDINEIISNTKTDFELLIEQKGAKVESEDIPPIRGNKLQLSQLFSNLIHNSLKFSEERPCISIRYKTVNGAEEIPDIPAGNYHLITVTDNGIGFDPQYADQIFQLFSRLHTRKDYGGTGIGLALCKKIVENHNGYITVKSEKGRGTTFSIFLPEL